MHTRRLAKRRVVNLLKAGDAILCRNYRPKNLLADCDCERSQFLQPVQ
jgi:hypothetical protein